MYINAFIFNQFLHTHKKRKQEHVKKEEKEHKKRKEKEHFPIFTHYL